MAFVTTNGFETKTTLFYRDQSLLTTKYVMEIFGHDIWGDEIRRKWGGGGNTWF